MDGLILFRSVSFNTTLHGHDTLWKTSLNITGR
jgi:hypothetical protein